MPSVVALLGRAFGVALAEWPVDVFTVWTLMKGKVLGFVAQPVGFVAGVGYGALGGYGIFVFLCGCE